MENQTSSSQQVLRKKIRGKIIEINLQALRHNIEFIKAKAKAKIFPVVKSNAYGHGIENIVPTIDRYADGWCVGTVEEAEKVRKFSKKEIIILKGISESSPDNFSKQDNIKIVARDKYDLEEKIKKGFTNIFIKIDTGMGRLGILPKEIPQILRLIKSNRESIKGIMSHFAFSDLADIEFIKSQIKLFKESCQKIESTLGENITKSIANSAGTLYLKESHFDFVRPGICVYGISPFTKNSSISAEEKIYFIKNLKPILSVKAEVIAVKQIEKGWSVGYSRKFVAQNRTKVAVISVGYSDGIPRAWWEKGYVSFKGKRLKIIGLISMDMLCIECNKVKIAPKDEVEILGNISAYEIAEATGTIPYEILCNIGIKEN